MGEVVVENWREVVGYPRYLVSNEGSVYDKVKRRALKQTLDRGMHETKRWRVFLRDESMKSRYVGKLVHRLVAEGFVSNNEGKTDVTHANGNGLDNRAWNLCWVNAQGRTLGFLQRMREGRY